MINRPPEEGAEGEKLRSGALRGKIIRGVGGFYYLYCPEDGRIYQCRARGLFRLNKIKPLVGDDVIFTETMDTDIEHSGQIEEILPRRNALIRPEAANVDQALILFALKDPEPSFLLLDRFLVYLSLQDIPAIIAFNKTELSPETKNKVSEDYADCGHPLLFTSNVTGEGLAELKQLLSGKTTILAGPSGVGKSSLTNRLTGKAKMEVGELSRKTKRGKQTTRHTELWPIFGEAYLLDTPGFSSLSLQGLERKALGSYFPEFVPFLGGCYYSDCVHLKEPDCAVRKAVLQGSIPRLRYENYRRLYAEL